MATFSSLYVRAPADDVASVRTSIEAALTKIGQGAIVRWMTGYPWVQLSPEGEPGEVDQPSRLGQQAVVPVDASGAERLACLVSALTGAEVVTVEAETTVDYLAFSRFNKGVAVRRYAYCPEDEPSTVRDEGEPAPWERPGMAPDYIAKKLSLPGFNLDDWTDTWTVAAGTRRSRTRAEV